MNLKSLPFALGMVARIIGLLVLIFLVTMGPLWLALWWDELKGIPRAGLRFGRWAVRKVKESETRPYQLPLSELIFRAENRHRLATGRSFTPCPFCETHMMFRHSKIVTTVGPVRDDQAWKCPGCHHTAHFGHPMTRELALAEIEVRGNPTLMRPSERPDEDGDEIVTERLRRLGYIE